MRKLKFILAIITVVIIAFTSLSQLNSQNNPNMKKGFYLGPMSHYFLNVLETGSHNQWYQELSYNMMHSYCAHLDRLDSAYEQQNQKDGGFFEDIDHYDDEMRMVIQNWKDIANDNSLIFEREKILRPAYGQRFTYQAEIPGQWRSVFPAFGYDDSETGQDITETWMYETVTSRNCVVGRDTAGFIVKNLYENCSQTNNLTRKPDSTNSSGWERLYSDIKQSEYNMRWFIKPRMRIDSVYAKTHMNDTVCIIYINNFSGNLVGSYILKCVNFLNITDPLNPQYDGRYLEMFNNLGSDSVNYLSVSADLLAMGKDTLSDSLSQVDYQVKWLGKVDVWLDYVRVDDSWAHYLFTDTWVQGQTYPPNNMWHFRERIYQEVNAFANTPGLGYFWVDEVQYPNLECIGEVNKLVKKYSYNQMSLIFITDPKAFMGWPAFRAINQSTIVDEANWDICINKAIDCGALSDIMITQWFPFYYTLRYPDVFNDIPTGYHITGKVQRAASYNQYTYIPDVGIQPSISWFVRQHKYFYKKAREKGLIYGVINQLNSDENNIQNGDVDWGIREPTNEEISMLMHTSMAYGAKIMIEFSYTSKLQDTGKHSYNWGLTTSDNDFSGKRDTNYYGQHKWEFVADLNDKLKRTGDYMYPMNHPNEHLIHDKTLTVNTVTYPDCNDCGTANHDYIQNIISYAPYNDISEMCTGSSMQVGHNDCSEQRYWELGFFNPNPNSSKPPDNNKYLYAVNKRTYPVNNTNDYGDRRVLKILFNSSSLTDFNNWVIKEAATDSVITYFNKLSTGFVYAGEFQPGEGKLLKIAPVMTEGGMLVCDEYINTNFTCNGMVFGNGQNITINQGKTISFKENAGIYMEGGCFVSGINSDNVEAVTLQGIGGTNKWRSITLNGCDSIGIYNTTIFAKDTSNLYSLSLINSYKVDFRKCNFITENDRGIIEAVYNSSSEIPAILKIRESNF